MARKDPRPKPPPTTGAGKEDPSETKKPPDDTESPDVFIDEEGQPEWARQLARDERDEFRRAKKDKGYT